MASVSPFRFKLLVYLIIIPLLMTLLASWQFRRVTAPGEAPGQNAPVVFHSGEIVPEAPQIFREASPEALNQLRLLALAALLSGLAATYAGGIGLYSVRRAAILGISSPEALCSGLRKSLSRMPLVVGGSAFFLALSLAFAFGYEVMDIAARSPWGEENRARLLLTAAGAATLFLLAAARIARKACVIMRTMLAPTPLRLQGRLVDEGKSPLVWNFVREAALKGKAPQPDAIVLSLGADFCATARPVILSPLAFTEGAQLPVPQGLVLALPLPCLAFLYEDEAAALLGRELGAFTGEGAVYARHFIPLRANAEEGLQGLERALQNREAGWFAFLDRPALMLGGCCLSAFAPAASLWAYERQTVAEQVSEAIAGPEAVARAQACLAWLSPALAAALQSPEWENFAWQSSEWESSEREAQTDELACLRRLVREKADNPELVESGLLSRLGLEEAPAEADKATGPGTRTAPLEQRRPATVALGPDALADKESGEPEGFGERGEWGEWGEQGEHLALLRELSAKGTDTRLFYEHAMGSMLACLGMSLLLCITASLIISERISVALACFCGSAILLWLAVQLVDRMKKPFVTLSKNGFQVGDMQENVAPWRIRRHERLKAGARRPEIPWTAVTDVINGMAGGMHVLTIRLAEAYEPPAFAHDRRVKYNPATRALTLRVLGFRKPDTLQAFGESLLDHWRGSMARRELRGLAKTPLAGRSD